MASSSCRFQLATPSETADLQGSRDSRVDSKECAKLQAERSANWMVKKVHVRASALVARFPHFIGLKKHFLHQSSSLSCHVKLKNLTLYLSLRLLPTAPTPHTQLGQLR